MIYAVVGKSTWGERVAITDSRRYERVRMLRWLCARRFERTKGRLLRTAERVGGSR